MAALPVVSSDDEEWCTAKSLLGDRNKTLENAGLSKKEAAFFGTVVGDSDVDCSCTEEPVLQAELHSGPASSSSSVSTSTHLPSADAHQRDRQRTSWAASIAAAHAIDHGAQYTDLRGKHDRTNTQKVVSWKVAACNHMAIVHNASLLGEARCSDRCAYHKQCMRSAFTVSTLRKCAARVFGEPVLDGMAPSIGKHTATQ
eukprot:6192822-Pleurochrysis_carterae.AAC.1